MIRDHRIADGIFVVLCIIFVCCCLVRWRGRRRCSWSGRGNMQNIDNMVSVLERSPIKGGGEAYLMPAAALWVVRPPPPDFVMNSLAETSDNVFHEKDSLQLDISTKARGHGGGSVRDSFQRAMRVPLIMGQLFSLMPISGILSSDPDKLRFHWCSWQLLYSAISSIGQSFVAVMTFYRLTQIGMSFNKSTSVVFYSSTALTSFLFIRVAYRWPRLVRDIAVVEAQTHPLRAPSTDSRRASERNTWPCGTEPLMRRCAIISIAVIVLASLEHILSILAGIEVALDCSPHKFVSEAFFANAFPWIFDYFDYAPWKGAVFQILNLQSTFNWNFMDIFIMSISAYLTERFEQINKRLLAVRNKYLPESWWRATRLEYARLADTVRTVDATINEVVFFSFANNLYFICLQLFHSLEDGIYGHTPACRDRSVGPLGGFEHAIYFTYSFIFLVGRAMTVSLLAARVHSAARTPAIALYDVPTPTYGIEVQRFLEQVNTDSIALTGLRFFNVTRGLILTVAGTIVTYELVLVQFNSVSPTEQTITLPRCNVSAY